MKTRELRFAVTRELYKQLEEEARARGCITLAEYLRFLINNRSGDRLFAALGQIGQELDSRTSFLGRLLRDK